MGVRAIVNWLINLFKKKPQVVFVKKRSYKSQALRDWEKKRKKLYKRLAS